MKTLILLPIFLWVMAANATDYYISANGNDANNGISPSSSWQSLNKLNTVFSSLKPGDNIYLNRGDIFYGSINVIKSGVSGAPITISAYGSGNKPVITGFASVNSWNNVGGNIWESSNAISSLSYTNIVVVKGVNTAMGRYPNSGYFYYQSHTGSGGSITSSDLTSSSNWTGAELAMFVTTYEIGRYRIINQSGNKLNYTPISGDANIQFDNQGFFIQNDERTLDIENEWYYNPATKKLRIYSSSLPSNVQLSTIDKLVNIEGDWQGIEYINLDNLSFTGSNMSSITVTNSRNITIQNCDFNYSGRDAIFGPFSGKSSNLKIENCSINNSNNNGIDISGDFPNASIRSNTISNIGVIPGMGQAGGGINGSGSYCAVVTTGSNTIIEYNKINNVGYKGIHFWGNNSSVKNNLIDTFCSLFKDGGGIYTWNGWPGTSNFNMKIQNNIVLNGPGDPGIYLDDMSNGVEVSGNSIENCERGIYLHNAWDVKLNSNTAFNTEMGSLVVYNDNSNVTMSDIKIRNNKFIAKDTKQQTAFIFPLEKIMPGLNSDSNYYARPIRDDSSITIQLNGNWGYKSLSEWKRITGQDANSKVSPTSISSVNDLRFEYNATSENKTISLGAGYIDITGKNYIGTITLNPYTSAVLIRQADINNQAPTANAGADKTITLPINTISLAGSGNDKDGKIASYLWTKISGPSAFNIVNASSPVTDVSGLVQGVYTFELKVTDDKGATATSPVKVTVNAAANLTPTANAGADKTITLPTNTVSLSGSGSDKDGKIASYLWTKISGPSSFNIVNLASPVINVSGLVQGVYTFELKVTDDKGATATSTAKVTVNAAANLTPTANAGADKTITLPISNISLSGSGSDKDGTITSYLWTKISGPSAFNIVNASSPVTDVSGLVQGVYTFELKVSDDKGATATSTVKVTVNAAANIAPTANAGADKTITLPINTISLAGSGNDKDGKIASYLWTKISGPSAFNIVNASSPVTDVSGLVQGVYTFELKVTDDKGATATSTVKVTVNAAANIAPTANAGADKTITLPINTISLAGSGNDKDGKIASYLWTKISGPSAFNIVNASSPVTDVSGLVQGVYTFELKVTDDKGATATSPVKVTVNAAANLTPTANAGADKTITLPTNTVSLSGSGSDKDGKIASYLWTKISGPSSFNIVNLASPVINVSGLVQGVYTFELKVTDDKGATATSTAKVTVNAAANLTPTANAGADKTITLPISNISLSGSGSDKDGTITSYLWTKISGPSAFNIVNASSPVTDVSGLVQGVYTFELKVSDDKGATATSTVKVTVNAAANIAPTANAGADKTITLPINTISLAGSGNDKDGKIASYLWTKISGPSAFNIVNASSPVTDVSGLVQGVYTFELKVTDDKGATATSTVKVTVNAAANIAPTANAGADKTITLPINTISLAGSGNDKDGKIASYLWTKISGPSAFNIVNASSPVTDVSGLVQGVYTFELKVTDDKGATATSPVKVTVNAAANLTPTANAGADKTITLPTNTVSLSGSGSDKDGKIASYLWTKISGPSSFNIVNLASPVINVSGLVQGVYTFELKVTDDKGATATSTAKVTVNAAANLTPTANAGADKTITLPISNISLSGSGSDKDGTITSYLWTKISGPSAFNIVNASSPVTDVSGLVQGVYTFELKVSDDKGATATSTVKVTVNAAANIAPTANAGADKTITLPINTISLAGSGNDKDGKIASYLWTKISGPSAFNIVNASSPVTDVSGLVQGVYTFELKVTDDKGATATSPVKVTVNAAANLTPSANAGADKTITLPTNTVSLSGSGSDKDGKIASYLWTKISGPSAFNIVNASSPVTDVSGLVQGVYTFELKVTDDKGATATSTAKVTVNAAANLTPSANAGADKTITLPTNTVSLSGSGSDKDGKIASYLWTKISGPSAFNIVNASSPVTDVSGLVQGLYTFELKVTDDKGATATSIVQITVNAERATVSNPNVAPMANAGNDTTILSPVDFVTLKGSGIDTDGKIIGYLWSQISGPSISIILLNNSATSGINKLVEGTYEFELTVTDNKGAKGKDTVKVTVALGRFATGANALKVYPNPVHDITTLEISSVRANTDLMIIITNMTGKNVYKKEFVSSLADVKEKINMSNLVKGTYVITVFFDGMEKQSIKVIRL